MNIMKKIFSILVFLCAAVAVSAQSLTILHLNDTHSHIEPERSGKYAGQGGVIEQAAYIDSVRTADGRKNVLLLHAGDFSQGTSYFTELGGDIEIELLNAMEFDAVALGNHEFDNGLEELARRLRKLKMPVLCANYDFAGSPIEDLVQPYMIIKKARKKIGIIGLLTDVSSVVDSGIASEMKYLPPEEVTDFYASYLRDRKHCDIIICLTHLGFEGEIYTDCELAEVTRNVDIIVGGHSHTQLEDVVSRKNADGEEVLIVTDWKWGLDVGRLSIF